MSRAKREKKVKHTYHNLKFTMKEHRELNALNQMHSLWYISDVTKGQHGTIVGRFRLITLAEVALDALNKRWPLRNKRKYIRRNP